MIAPASTPGRLSGTIIFVSVSNVVAPRLLEASMTDVGMRSSWA